MLESLRFILVETTHSGNIGAAARAMKTMGFNKLRLVRPCKFLSADSLARASGADEILREAEVFDSLKEAVADCAQVYGSSARSRSLEWSASTLPQVAERIVSDLENHPAPSAVVFGRERSGLSNEELALCNGRLWIPSNPDFSSLNLGSAVQVVAYECRRSAGFEYAAAGAAGQPLDAPPDDPDVPADHAALEHFFEHLEKTMTGIDFLKPDNPRLLLQRMRRLYGRARLLRSEVQLLRGFLTAVDKSTVEKGG